MYYIMNEMVKYIINNMHHSYKLIIKVVYFLYKGGSKMKRLGLMLLTAAGSVAIYEYLKKVGVTDEITGRIKRIVGSATDDVGMQVEGLFDTGKGKAKSAFNDAKEAVEDVVEDL